MKLGETAELGVMGTQEVPKLVSWNVNTASVNQEGEVTELRKGKISGTEADMVNIEYTIKYWS